MCTCQSRVYVEDHVNYDKYRYLTKMSKLNLEIDITSLITFKFASVQFLPTDDVFSTSG